MRTNDESQMIISNHILGEVQGWLGRVDDTLELRVPRDKGQGKGTVEVRDQDDVDVAHV